jgi:glycosyltransferase involved in cell wall biosynthesis
MTRPIVSILLPNLNNIRFLPERIDTIYAQTFQEWELVISDNFSDDGAWEYFQSLAAKDSRISIFQSPRNGMYSNWNNTIEKARGTYVYIATSDDTMPSDCLAEMVNALESCTECDIAHCPLNAIGVEGENLDLSWYRNTAFPLSCGDLFTKAHIRYAPFDGLLHLMGSSVYWSITQLLIRRSVFDKVGLFESQWGSMGDYNWNLRASMVSNTVHVPTTWGGWRIHPSQATALCPKDQFQSRMEDMIDHAVVSILPRIEGRLKRKIMQWSHYFREKNGWWSAKEGKLNRVAHAAKLALRGNLVAKDYLAYRLGVSDNWNLPSHELVRRWCDDCGLSAPMVAVQRNA